MSRDNYNLREKERKSIFECYSLEEDDLNDEDESDRGWNRKRLRQTSRTTRLQEFNYDKNEYSEDSDVFNSREIYDQLPDSKAELNGMLEAVKNKLKVYKQHFLKEQGDIKGIFQVM